MCLIPPFTRGLSCSFESGLGDFLPGRSIVPYSSGRAVRDSSLAAVEPDRSALEAQKQIIMVQSS